MMKTFSNEKTALRPAALIAMTAATLMATACASTPAPNSAFTQAQQAYQSMRAIPQVESAAGVEANEAKQALQRAEVAWRAERERDEIDTLASIAESRAKQAAAIAKRRQAQTTIDASGAERARLLIASKERDTIKAQSREQMAERENDQLRTRVADAEQRAEAARTKASRLSDQMEDLQAKKTDRGLVVTLDGVLFESGSANLKAGADRKLQQIAEILQKSQESKVVIEGFTDSTGGEALNLDLSTRRAKAVELDLMRKGIAADRMQARGLGEAYPIAPNDNPSGRQQNRRVELVISDTLSMSGSRTNRSN